ncbi:DNA replication and repair protein RecF [Pontibacter ummariensis]|uniref:DNA replication and repair protein RecF n=1 Tax=Pontibacter ummariensis TaxID=1610492 RepID=A0A239CGA8_9BACT|nr:DNA replication/repair protein RecF [Pontibacter ummariensis]PRY15032.1 DNA replication and repair protein RecF [Pontibacter ummariensis]SNS19130.1 DNA replication and repair protein RecF [Pontibacter ummariensis]
MLLENLSLLFFKNYEEASLSFSEHINCFIGDNGSGKTNLLDAIYYLSMTRSAFPGTEAQSVKQGEDFFMVKGRFEVEGSKHTVQVSLKQGQKKTVMHNKVLYEKMSEHIGRFPVVLISPYDTDLIREGSEERRRYFDSLISQLNHAYLEQLIQYNHILKQRNSLLKQFAERHYYDQEYLQVLNEQLVPLGEQLAQERQNFLQEFIPIFQKHYHHISGSSEEVSLTYKSQLEEDGFAQKLRQAERKDLALQRTTVGPHKDDFVFLMDGNPVKSFGSQGQQKSYVIALKLAHFEVVDQRQHHKPLLLLDDIFDRLDEKRITQLMQMVAAHTFGQIFLTDTHLERTDKILEGLSESIRRFEVKEGTVKVIRD